MKNPMVSVLMPAFNAGTYLAQAVESVLRQTLRNFELIVVDDGSTDDSIASLTRIADERLVILRNPRNMGLIATRNRCVSVARAPLLACLDADDIALPNRLEVQVAHMHADPSLAILGSCAELIDTEGRVFGNMDTSCDETSIRRNILQHNAFVNSSVLMRTNWVREVGGYSSLYGLAEDYALYIKIMRAHRAKNLSDRLIQYRIHPGQISIRRIAKMRKIVERVQADAWRIWAHSMDEILPPTRKTLRYRMRGWEGTVGADFLGWAKTYKQMGLRRQALTAILGGLRASPMSSALWAEMWWHIRTNGEPINHT